MNSLRLLKFQFFLPSVLKYRWRLSFGSNSITYTRTANECYQFDNFYSGYVIHSASKKRIKMNNNDINIQDSLEKTNKLKKIGRWILISAIFIFLDATKIAPFSTWDTIKIVTFIGAGATCDVMGIFEIMMIPFGKLIEWTLGTYENIIWDFIANSQSKIDNEKTKNEIKKGIVDRANKTAYYREYFEAKKEQIEKEEEKQQ